MLNLAPPTDMTGRLFGNGSSSSGRNSSHIVYGEELQVEVHKWNWFWFYSEADRDNAIAFEPGLQTPET